MSACLGAKVVEHGEDGEEHAKGDAPLDPGGEAAAVLLWHRGGGRGKRAQTAAPAQRSARGRRHEARDAQYVLRRSVPRRC